MYLSFAYTGLCGLGTVQLYSNYTHRLRYGRPIDCVWFILGEPGSWIRVDLHRLPSPCKIAFQADNSTADIIELERSVISFVFPSVITFRATALRVWQKCPPVAKDLPGDNVWLDFSLSPYVGLYNSLHSFAILCP